MNELWLYGVIEDGDVSAKSVRDELSKFDRRAPILARLNSPGGSVFEAVAIHTQLSQWTAGVDVQVDGLAASAASYVATVGRTVGMARDAMLMIHDAWGITVGNAADHESARDTLDKISDQLVQAYVAKSGKSKSQIRQAMKSETWFTAEGAVEFGLADYIIGADGLPATRDIAALQRRLDSFAAMVR